MASKEHWIVDPANEIELWNKIVGKDREDPLETAKQAHEIIGRRTGVRCLEIGAGVGRLLKEANKSFYEALGVDSSVSMVALSTRYLQDRPHCRVILGDGFSLPFPRTYFDFIYSFTCFQHMPDLDTVSGNIQEAYRVLLPGGTMVLQTVYGPRDTGAHDGYVFPSIDEFGAELVRYGRFVEPLVELRGPWLWATVKKPSGVV